jgi:hypothetical protein
MVDVSCDVGQQRSSGSIFERFACLSRDGNSKRVFAWENKADENDVCLVKIDDSTMTGLTRR